MSGISEQEIIQKADAALAQEFELDIVRLRPEARLRDDLGLDSLDAVDMVVVLEQTFGIKIGKDQALASIRTIGDIHDFILKKKRDFDDAC
ncbi:MAG: phosphopantetheine-binding protein [Desulfovibrio sp.]|jgi:acyl carrier protein|nr:phosphopantetheine-binding protein [Desulfovibrio sp.]